MVKSIVTKLILSILRPEERIGSSNTLKEILKFPVILIFPLSLFNYVFKKDNRDKRLRKKSDDLEEVRNYNFSVTFGKLITRSRRAEIYYKISSLIIPDLANKKLLIIGPRNVQELYMAWIYGFSWKNIQAIDLYSSHNKIKVMDMHNL